MKSGSVSVDQLSKLLDLKLKPVKSDLSDLKAGLKSVIGTQAGHTKTLEAHSESLADIEHRIIPLTQTVGAVAVDHSKRIGEVEGRVDELEPRVEVLETVVSK